MYVKHYFNHPQRILYNVSHKLYSDTQKSFLRKKKKKSSTFFHPKDFICLIAWLGYQMNLQLTVPHDNVEIIRQIHMMSFLLVHI